jgi:hypothetical protein
MEGMVGDGSPEDNGESSSSVHRNFGRFLYECEKLKTDGRLLDDTAQLERYLREV